MGISSRTLAERLRQLEREGIVRRHSYPESPPRVEYELTDKGLDLLPVIEAMTAYGALWLVPAERPSRSSATSPAPSAASTESMSPSTSVESHRHLDRRRA